MSIVGSLRRFPGTPTVVLVLTPIFAIAIWSWLIWRIWQRPRQWGLGVGIFLLLMIGFQTFLWRLAVASPRPDISAESYSTFSFILYELPLLVAGVSCILLRFRYPNELKPSTT